MHICNFVLAGTIVLNWSPVHHSPTHVLLGFCDKSPSGLKGDRKWYMGLILLNIVGSISDIYCRLSILCKGGFEIPQMEVINFVNYGVVRA